MPTKPTLEAAGAASVSGRASSGPESRGHWLILAAALGLTLFFYWTRTDTIGVRCPTRGWFPMTAAPLGPAAYCLAAGLLLGVMPLAVARLAGRLGWAEIGLGWGRGKVGAFWLLVGIPVAVLAGWVSAASPITRAVYPLDAGLTPTAGPFLLHAARLLVYYTAWELLFRGILLAGLTRTMGFAGANVLQTALSVVAHFGRPFMETAAAIPAGLAFGGVARATGSIWYVVIIHWVVGLAQDWFIITG
jgi:membrane protease YdiL (CAAX protease family)